MPRKYPPGYVPKKPGRPQKYPWDTWFDGKRHFIQPDDDYEVSTASMRRQVYTAAESRDIRVTVQAYGTGLVIQAGGAPARYDWDRLLDGTPHTLHVDRDLTATPESFRQYARRQALSRGRRLESRLLGSYLSFRAVNPDGSEVQPAATVDLPFEVDGP